MADLPPSTTVTSPLLTPPYTTVTSSSLTPPSSAADRIIIRTTTIFRKYRNRLLNWREHYGYSFPFVMLITIWNLAIVTVTLLTLLWTVNEKPNMPLRVWLAVKSLQRAVDVLLLWLQYHRRTQSLNSSGIRFTRAVLLPNAIFGFRDMFNDDLLFLSNLRSFLLFQQRGASPAEINILPKYKVFTDEKQLDGRVRRMVPVGTNSPAFSSVRVLQAEDSGCCICLCKYEDGAKLNSLPCKHHFHAACVFKWLMIKATCPLCRKVIY